MKYYNDIIKFIAGYIAIFFVCYVLSDMWFIEFTVNYPYYNLLILFFSYPTGLILQVLLEIIFPVKSDVTNERKIFLKHVGINIGSALFIIIVFVIYKIVKDIIIGDFDGYDYKIIALSIPMLIGCIMLNRRNLK